MASVSFDRSTSTSVEISADEIETLKKAHGILYEISSELWDEEGGDETETFENTSAACDCIEMFLRNDCGVDVQKLQKIYSD